MVTETDELSRALDIAALRWPEAANSRTELLRRIVHEGVVILEREHAARTLAKRSTLLDAAGALTGTWPTNWREELRDEWPT